MRGQTLVFVWIISVIAIYLVGALVMGAISSSFDGNGVDLVRSSYTDPEYILLSVVLASVFTPFCYCCAMVNE